MTLFLDDGDVRLYHGDALETVRAMPDESVDCVVTSPPYWGLRDYGTGTWEGGNDPDCDHEPDRTSPSSTLEGGKTTQGMAPVMPSPCIRCGAHRVDDQIGLEATPDEFVDALVAVFREIRRVMTPHGTCWVNLGDSYSGGKMGRADGERRGVDGFTGGRKFEGEEFSQRAVPDGMKPKDLVGIPWRVAFALQADGWWLRADIIWAKPNPMPESVTDRPTKAHEYVFLLTKAPRYWFDTEAVREPNQLAEGNGWNKSARVIGEIHGDGQGAQGKAGTHGLTDLASGRNVRSVWQIATQPYPEAHFATYPEELARRCILAGCPIRVCRVCGKPSERIVDTSYDAEGRTTNGPRSLEQRHETAGFSQRLVKSTSTVGWSDCECRTVHQTDVTRVVMANVDKWRPGVVLDPFIGSGTTAKVARDHQRHAIGIDLNERYLELAARRLQQLSLLT